MLRRQALCQCPSSVDGRSIRAAGQVGQPPGKAAAGAGAQAQESCRAVVQTTGQRAISKHLLGLLGSLLVQPPTVQLQQHSSFGRLARLWLKERHAC